MTGILHKLGRKALDAKAKHRWLSACAEIRTLNDKPGALRVAIVLFELYDPKLGFAYPSRRYLSARLGSPQENISKWIGLLKGSGALEVVSARNVPPDVLRKTRRTAKRANYYRLNFDWADDVLDGIPEAKWDGDEGEFQEPRKVVAPLLNR